MRRMEDAYAKLDAFWALSTEQLLQQLGASLNGLSESEAAERLQRYGANTLYRAQHTHRWAILLRQFSSPIVLILLGAAVVAGVLGDGSDTLIILAIVAASGLLGFWQEASASDAMRRLLQQVQVEAEVVRDGQCRSVPIDQLAPGDIVRLNTGDMIPADGVVLHAQNLQVNEAILTGESFPAEKSPQPTPADAPLLQRTNALWMGSYVASGMGTMLVVATGSRTQLGQIAQRLRLRPDETDFERGVRRFGNLLLEVTLMLVLLIFAFNVYLQRPVVDAFLFSVALAVGLTPQLLPAIITVNLAQGAMRMARARVLVKRLASIENLGSMQVLCSDKTGTLTEGVVGVHDARNAQGQSDAQVLHYAALNAALQQGFSNPIDDALRQRLEVNLSEYEYLGEIPYDFYRKRLSVAVRRGDIGWLMVKGALPQVLELCTTVQHGQATVPLTDARTLLEQAEGWMAQGYRVLGVAVKPIAPDAPITPELEQQLTFVGYILITDPPKATARATLEQLQQAGVVLKVITGDHASAARALMHALGYPQPQVLTAAALEQMSEEALIQRAPAIDVFAEVEPYHKERIIRALRKAGYTVGYLGDGINDAPALHAADVGISVDTAADVAKDAADIVLLEKDLSVLMAGIREGRRTFANTLKYVFMATSANFGNMFSMAGASLFLSFLPLLPKQILLNNFLTDLPEMAIATDNVDEELTLRPTRWDIHFIRNFMLAFGLLSSVFDYLTFGVLMLLLQASPEEFRSGWFVESVISASMVVLMIRTRRPFFRSLPSRLLLGLSVLVWAVTLWLPYSPLNRVLGFTPLPWAFLAALGGILALYMLSAELLKRWFYRNHLK
ncbi:MAG: magnesium-translocating P-type ATPase [Fimbriimonadales bacterium]|nr:magnesium-translocating P-type ATPase [Fimbriimonadales bacterium]